MWADTEEEKKIWEDLAEKVTEKYPEITVKLQTSAFSGYYEKLTTQITSGTAPDIMALQATRTASFAPYNAFAPLDSFFEKTPEFDVEDVEKSILDAFSYNNETLLVPYDFGPLILYYNKDIFDQYGVDYPKDDMSWDEFVETAKKVTQDTNKDGKPDTYGFAFSTSFNQFIPWILNNGGHYLNEDDTKSLIQEREATEAIQFLGDLIYKDKVAMPNSDPGNLDFDTENFYSGKVAMIVGGPWNFGNVYSKAQFKWDIATIPAGTAGPVTTVNGSGFGINAKSGNKDAAWKALSVILGKEGIDYLVESGRSYPARISSLEKFKEINQLPDNFDAVSKAASNGSPIKTSEKNWSQIVQVLNDELGNVWFNNVPAKEVTKNIESQINSLLE
nr:sugar ABC transporter substrate-binding protein [Lederbergia citrea]